jgi:hypothetical protein
VQRDNRYPFVYHDRATWGRIGVSFASDTDYITFTTLLEHKPGGAWAVVEMTPDEAEQMARRILERVAVCRSKILETT